jgi:hypothetical protein
MAKHNGHFSVLSILNDIILERMILFGENAVWKATAEFVAHYHSERNHQGLDNALICPEPELAGAEGEVHRRKRLGGLLKLLLPQGCLRITSTFDWQDTRCPVHRCT